jgi:hypothetical protein
MDPTKLTLHLLEEITNEFSDERKVGEGAYGTVYRVRAYLINNSNAM